MVRSLRPLNILVLVHPELVPPDSLKGYSDKEVHVFKTEYDVISTLKWRGHDVRPLGLKDELKPIRDAIDGSTPPVVFNLLEEFHGQATYDQNVASFLELLRLPYTGCNPRGLMLARGKALSKTGRRAAAPE
jgi:D-alanine-D-alanine ligase